VIVVSFNGAAESVSSLEGFSQALDRFDAEADFELWLSVSDGPSMCMLRNGGSAFVMYLRFAGDSGFVSGGSCVTEGSIEYRLSNGQIDGYPLAWCIPLEQCYKALAYFFVNEGKRPEWIAWHES
jgi:hypothetical protein